jgi:hypothetical protein
VGSETISNLQKMVLNELIRRGLVLPIISYITMPFILTTKFILASSTFVASCNLIRKRAKTVSFIWGERELVRALCIIYSCLLPLAGRLDVVGRRIRIWWCRCSSAHFISDDC